MAKELDNKKMWESILRQMKSSVNPTMGEINIVRALRDQGLTWDGKEIVSIEPEPRYHIGVDIGDPKGDIGVKQEYRKPEPFDIEKGMWLMCIKDYSSFDNSPLLFKKGNLYQCEDCEYVKYGIGDDEAYRFIACWRHFRPATTEEIPHSESDQEELNEFEKALEDIFGEEAVSALRLETPEEFTKIKAKELLSIARKQFIEEACKWLGQNMQDYCYSDYCGGELTGEAYIQENIVDDFRKALEKG